MVHFVALIMLRNAHQPQSSVSSTTNYFDFHMIRLTWNILVLFLFWGSQHHFFRLNCNLGFEAFRAAKPGMKSPCRKLKHQYPTKRTEVVNKWWIQIYRVTLEPCFRDPDLCSSSWWRERIKMSSVSPSQHYNFSLLFRSSA